MLLERHPHTVHKYKRRSTWRTEEGHDYRTVGTRVDREIAVLYDDVRDRSDSQHGVLSESGNVDSFIDASSSSYIDTENTYSALRQSEFLQKTKNPYASLNNIFVWRLATLDAFLQLLDALPRFLAAHPNVFSILTNDR